MIDTDNPTFLLAQKSWIVVLLCNQLYKNLHLDTDQKYHNYFLQLRCDSDGD